MYIILHTERELFRFMVAFLGDVTALGDIFQHMLIEKFVLFSNADCNASV